LSVVTYLLHNDVTGWTDYVNKHYMLRWSRQSESSSDSLITKNRKIARKFSAAWCFGADIC